MRDAEVVASIVAGDPEALAAAYDRYAASLYAYCRSMLSDPADAADAVQDTFVIAASRLGGLRDPARLRAWLHAVARNECLRIARARKSAPGLSEAADVADAGADVSRGAERAELRALLRDASRGLNPREREVIEFQLRQGLEPAEIAAILGVSRNHAHSLLSRARGQLLACLGALLVSRSGREDCRELDSMLAGWDGQLTVLLRKRLHRHIERCGTCARRRSDLLRPSGFLGLSPLAAMASAAAEGLKLAPPVPGALRQHVLALATAAGPSAAAHRAAVPGRAGSFGKEGFPRPHAARAGRPHGAAAAVARLPRSARGQAAAAVIAAAAVTAAAFALAGNGGTEHLALAGARPPAHGGGSGKPALPVAASGPPSGGAATAPATTAPATTAPATTAPATAVPGTTAPGTSPSAPAPTVPVTTSPAGPSSAPSPGTPPASPAPGQPPPPARSGPPVPPPAPGTLAASPAGGVLIAPPGGTAITLTAQGGPVSWTVTVSGGTGGLTVLPSSGTLRPGQSVTVTVTASRFAAGQRITISPGDFGYTLLFAWSGGPGGRGALPRR
jgi:RNA polymerase sigma factor (sigma-70 family)